MIELMRLLLNLTVALYFSLDMLFNKIKYVYYNYPKVVLGSSSI